jgi:hypothetical protein
LALLRKKGRTRVLVVGIPDISDDDLFFPSTTESQTAATRCTTHSKKLDTQNLRRIFGKKTIIPKGAGFSISSSQRNSRASFCNEELERAGGAVDPQSHATDWGAESLLLRRSQRNETLTRRTGHENEQGQKETPSGLA